MIKIQKLLALVLALLTALPVQAQTAGGYERAPLVLGYNTNSATYEYPRLVGVSDATDQIFDPWDEGIKSPGRVSTGGLTTTLDAQPGTPPFTALAVGDSIRVVVNGKVQERLVTNIGGAPTSIAVSPSIDLPLNNSPFADSRGFALRYKKRVVSAAAADGWFSMRGFNQFAAQINVTTLVSTSIQAQLECRINQNGFAQTGVVVDSTSISAANTNAVLPSTATGFFLSEHAFDECRVGIKVTGDAGVDSVSVWLLGKRDH